MGDRTIVVALARNEAGAWRIITDWKKNLPTMIVHSGTVSGIQADERNSRGFEEVLTRIGNVKITWKGGKISRPEIL